MKLALTAIAFYLVAAQSPATQPSSRPAFSRLLLNLDSPSATTRYEAYRSLLGLGRADLPELLAAVKAFPTLSKEALSQLRLAVMHVYLSEEPFEYVEGGALGIILDQISLPGPPSDDGFEREAILVTDCRPGFAAYRYLEPGDIITGFVGGPEKFNRQSFGDIIRRAGANRPITLQLLRRGKSVEVTVVLSRRPLWLENANNREPLYDQEWLRTGESYWDTTFAPVVGATEEP